MPLPLPGDPLVMVIHGAAVVAVQLHPLDAVTFTVPLPAVDVRLADAGETVGEQEPPDWFTVNVTPPTDTVPVRGEIDVFAATE